MGCKLGSLIFKLTYGSVLNDQWPDFAPQGVQDLGELSLLLWCQYLSLLILFHKHSKNWVSLRFTTAFKVRWFACARIQFAHCHFFKHKFVREDCSQTFHTFWRLRAKPDCYRSLLLEFWTDYPIFGVRIERYHKKWCFSCNWSLYW